MDDFETKRLKRILEAEIRLEMREEGTSEEDIEDFMGFAPTLVRINAIAREQLRQYYELKARVEG